MMWCFNRFASDPPVRSADRPTLSVAPGPDMRGVPPAGRPVIIPHTLSIVADQDGGRWTTSVRRSAHEVHPAVTNDPRMRSPVATARASIVQGISEAGTKLAQSLGSRAK